MMAAPAAAHRRASSAHSSAEYGTCGLSAFEDCSLIATSMMSLSIDETVRVADVQVYLVDGTYELFRHFYGMPEESRQRSRLGAVRGVIETLLALLAEGVTHL